VIKHEVGIGIIVDDVPVDAIGIADRLAIGVP
jgi:hypothetical protein